MLAVKPVRWIEEAIAVKSTPATDVPVVEGSGNVFADLGLPNAQELRTRTADLFAHYAAGRLQVAIDREFPLADAADAHRALESRTTQGKVLLVP